MNEDVEALMQLVDSIKDLSELADQQNQSAEEDAEKVLAFVELGKQISDLEHRVKLLENENAFLRMLLKERFGYDGEWT